MIAITGATGFVGRRLYKALAKDFSAESIRVLTRARPAADEFFGGSHVCHGRLEDRDVTPALVHDAEVVIHVAAQAQSASYEGADMRQVNVAGTRYLYSAAVAAGCKLFLHVSSAGVYGPARGSEPFGEEDVARPVTLYQQTKWEAEEALREIDAKRTVLNILRPAGLYGPGTRVEINGYRRVLSERLSVELTGDFIGHPTHVDDLVEAIIALVRRAATHGAVFNIGGERPIRLHDFESLAAEILGVRRRRLIVPSEVAWPLALIRQNLPLFKAPKPHLAARSRGSVFSIAVDDRRFRKLYPGVPVVKLRDGVREHIAWARQQRLL